PSPPPGRPAVETRSQTLPVISTNAGSPVQSNPAIPPRPKRNVSTPGPQHISREDEAHDHQRAPPPLPSRTSSAQSAPMLPPRRASAQPQTLMVRRGSGSSELSQHSTISSLSVGRPPSSVTSQGSDGTAHKVPPAYDPTSLPKLPPTRREREAQAAAAKEAARPTRSLPAPLPARSNEYAPVQTKRPVQSPLPAPSAQPTSAPAPRPSLPPRLPSRPAKSQSNLTPEPEQETQPRKLPPRSYVNAKAPVIIGFSSRTNQPHQDSSQGNPSPSAARPSIPSQPRSEDGPPPVPIASRPSAAQIRAFEDRAVTPAGPVYGCLFCRDWSGPDTVAAQHPRNSIPRSDPVGYLAQNLCDPFPSYTDKARAIFTWFHHNIDYDTVAFFGNAVKHQTAEDTIFTGKAVCAGYSDTYKAIANRAGLECVVVSGHGKGFGHTPLKAGERPPPAKPNGHAWNAVRIDGGDWKLLDACWGAGHLSGQSYQAAFSPIQFTNGNENFGSRHFPKESRYQFRPGGEVLSWEDYYTGGIDGEPHGMCGQTSEEGIAAGSIEPKQRHIPIDSGEIVRFQFSKVCEHWSKDMCGGKERLIILSLPRGEGEKDKMVPMQTDGFWSWLDVNANDLGPRGKSVRLLVLTKFGDRDPKDVTGKEFLSKVGRIAMGWSYLVTWDLV
ncbi:hypothetical protein FZEAL_10802, partial [Fusarium zealandicum]